MRTLLNLLGLGPVAVVEFRFLLGEHRQIHQVGHCFQVDDLDHQCQDQVIAGHHVVSH
jgi:hypothetical protein